MRQIDVVHFPAPEQHLAARLRHVARNPKRQRRLAHAWPPCQHNELRRHRSQRLVIQRPEPVWQPARLAVILERGRRGIDRSRNCLIHV